MLSDSIKGITGNKKLLESMKHQPEAHTELMKQWMRLTMSQEKLETEHRQRYSEIKCALFHGLANRFRRCQL